MTKNVGNNQKQKIDFNDDAFLKTMMKSIPKEMTSKKSSLSGKVIGAIMSNPKSIIPFIVVLIYFASMGFGLHLYWLIKLILTIF